ncbi:protein CHLORORESPIRATORY REDUCTION 42, chloroplastic [Alnus glutinosa]|uniref:protein CHLORORESPIRATORY REDUCTION 42, chloroplastic n=1 Tax=Alnus glutinosa TaxID=3517 RepID=UPI002D777F14|nr:protein CHLORORESPIRATORY REDUCTION 42, chloroplastic [Alnus glutinosa]
MALSISSTSTMIFSKSPQFVNRLRVVKTKCESKEPPPETGRPPAKSSKLEIGSPVIVIEAPKMIKTAASVPCLRVNSGLVNPGDVGRIVSRKPKDLWAVRLTVGTYLIDGKYFKPLQLDE